MNATFDPQKEALNAFVVSSRNGHLLQSYEWGEAQKYFGEPVFRVAVKDGEQILAAATVIVKTFYKNFHYLYCPRGPLFSGNSSVEAQHLLLSAIQEEAKKRGSIFLRVSPELPELSEIPLWLAGFKKSNQELEPHESLILDLTKTEEQLLSEMKPKTRYNIKVAQKKGVTVTAGTDESFLNIFLQINKETAKRDKFTAHKDAYYQAMLRALAPAGFMKVYVAYANQKPIAANLVSTFSNRATYMHGASSNEGRNLMPTFALQWEAIRDAKIQGKTEYDFWGITTSEDENHPWAGITRFKTGFGGTVVKYIGAYDQVYRKGLATLYSLYKKFR